MGAGNIELLIIVNRIHKDPLAITRPCEHAEIIVHDRRHDAVVLHHGFVYHKAKSVVAS